MKDGHDESRGTHKCCITGQDEKYEEDDHKVRFLEGNHRLVFQ